MATTVEGIRDAVIRSMGHTLTAYRERGQSNAAAAAVVKIEGRTEAAMIRLASKIRDEYSSVMNTVPTPTTPSKEANPKTAKQRSTEDIPMGAPAAKRREQHATIQDNDAEAQTADDTASAMKAAQRAAGLSSKPTPFKAASDTASSSSSNGGNMALVVAANSTATANGGAITAYRAGASGSMLAKPEWHAPWKLFRVISGHMGWVCCSCVDPGNEWIATGSADRTIKIWDVATGALRLTLTGHISTVRGLAVSDRHPYLFSCGEDKAVKNWDLEYNKVIRHFHGHLGGVYCIALHPTLDVLITGGRDSSPRVWDIRTQSCVHVLEGHTNTVMSLASQAADPQVISGSMDTTVKLWDLAAGKVASTLTHHKKGIRGIALHPTEFSMLTGAADNLKKWRFPAGDFLCNFSGHKAIVNAVGISRDNVAVSAGDNGSLHFWDWKTGYNFQAEQVKPQPGSLESEAGIYALSFDRTTTRLFTCEADKTIKVWRPDEDATEATHPIAKNWRANRDRNKF